MAEPKQLGNLGPVDRWIRGTGVFCLFWIVVKVLFLVFSEAWGHAHFSFEAWPGFFALCGFLGFALLVFAGRILGLWVRRPEHYYDPELKELKPGDPSDA